MRFFINLLNAKLYDTQKIHKHRIHKKRKRKYKTKTNKKNVKKTQVE